MPLGGKVLLFLFWATSWWDVAWNAAARNYLARLR